MSPHFRGSRRLLPFLAALTFGLIAQGRACGQTYQPLAPGTSAHEPEPGAAVSDMGAGMPMEARSDSSSAHPPWYIGGNFAVLTECAHAIGDFCDRPSYGRFWFSAEALLWWQRDPRAPALVTSSPAGTPFGTAGVLGNSTTAILFGGGVIDQGVFGGSRLTVGGLLPNSDNLGFEASGFLFGKNSTNFNAGSNAAGSPPIGVPFLGAISGQEAVNMVAFPGTFAGTVNVSQTSQLWGAEGNFVAKANAGGDTRLTVLAGFRYLDLLENLDLTQNSTVLAGGGLLFNGVTKVAAPNGVQISDAFGTRNQFYGGQVGVQAGRDFGPFTIDVNGKIALGNMHEAVNIQGSSALVTPQGVTATVPGGLFAVASNSGHETKDVFAAVPEVELRLGYQLCQRLGVFVSGNFLYVSDVVRPGDQIDRTVNVTQVPTSFAFGLPGGPARPAPEFNHTGFWAAGINFGMKFSY